MYGDSIRPTKPHILSANLTLMINFSFSSSVEEIDRNSMPDVLRELAPDSHLVKGLN